LKPVFYPSKQLVAGTDEAGRGCLAGPVVAAAVILPPNFEHPRLNDSKKMSKKDRDLLRPIIEKEAISWAIGICTAAEIDEINILNASFEAMHRALNQLNKKPKLIIVDGNRFKKYNNTAHECIIKGDGKYLQIAAASVLAKTYRDEMMEKIAENFPHYKWNKNAGYPTPEHREAIRKFGVTPHHRLSYQLLPSQLELFVRNT
jgi:ribonuclease HII